MSSTATTCAFSRANARACPIRFLGGQNCCTDSGVLHRGGACGLYRRGEEALAEARAAGVTHYLGRILRQANPRALPAAATAPGACFTSELGRILHEQARPQLGMTWEDCRGFSGRLKSRGSTSTGWTCRSSPRRCSTRAKPPGISLPDAGATGAAMRERIGEFYDRSE